MAPQTSTLVRLDIGLREHRNCSRQFLRGAALTNNAATCRVPFKRRDDSEVAIYFRDYQSGARKLRAVFPGSQRKDFIDRQRRRYAELLARCWLVSGAFLSRLEALPAADLTALKRAAV